MNQKKAKLLRKLAAQEGKFQTEANYSAMETKKMVYFTDREGRSRVEEVTRLTVFNSSRTEYRQLKQAYKNREFGV